MWVVCVLIFLICLFTIGFNKTLLGTMAIGIAMATVNFTIETLMRGDKEEKQVLAIIWSVILLGSIVAAAYFIGPLTIP